jgi:ligand-binding sensor protein
MNKCGASKNYQRYFRMIRSVPEHDRKITEVHLSKPNATATTTKPLILR